MEILYEDNHIIIVNKHPGEIVQGDKTGDVPLVETVRQFLKEKYDKPGNVFCGVVHRLDRPVWGLVIFAKTSKALSRLNEMLRKGEIKKTYWAITRNMPEKPEARLVNFITTIERSNKSFVWDKPAASIRSAFNFHPSDALSAATSNMATSAQIPTAVSRFRLIKSSSYTL